MGKTQAAAQRAGKKSGGGKIAAAKENQQLAMSEENVHVKSKVHHRLSSAKTPTPRAPLQDENSASNKQMKFQVKCTVKREMQKEEGDEQNGCVFDADSSTKSSKELNSERNAAIEEGAETAATVTPTGCETAIKDEPTAQLSVGKNGTKTNAKPVQRKGKGKSPKRTGVKNSTGQNRKVTDYYPVRRSYRKCEGQLKSEEKKIIDDLIRNGKEEGMKVGIIDGKGRGVMATKPFQRGEFVVEYNGDLIEFTDAKSREAKYAQDPSTGCYMYYFQYLSKNYCVDATKETTRLGRLINHSKNGNCQTKLHNVDGKPHLILVASRDIAKGEELLYDYGDRSKASIAAHPWLKQ
ncbi:N-lysine methyltransferase KMT5A-A [Carcharodon carcharias]|uniref:N-lysine methyltransferase KMT5A-A n=1 Tax=Carcharodon carcharias TaxID=13397 RepID=UPI001B7D9136|nr:N-lysine methyltransferase KMT5A-A [Carcharodon carcharias]